MSTLEELGLNRSLTDGISISKDRVISNSLNSASMDSGADEQAAPSILTGTVITACLFRSTDAANKIEIQNNDMTMYDASTGGGGAITGDTSSIVFSRSDQLPGEFLIQKRKSKLSNLGNVFEMYYTERDAAGAANWIFMGREGQGNNLPTYTDNIIFHAKTDIRTEINRISDYNSRPTFYTVDVARLPTPAGVGVASFLNGEGPNGYSCLGFLVEMLTFSDTPDFQVGDTITGNSTGATALITKVYTPNLFFADHTSYGINFDPALDNACTTDGIGGGSGTGNLSARSWQVWYSVAVDHTLNLILGSDFIPDSDISYDIGSPSKRIKTLYVDSIVGGIGNDAFNFNTTFECLDTYTQTVNGAGGVIDNSSGYLSMLTGATATNNVVVERSTISPMSWDKDRILKAYIVVPNVSQISAYFGNGDFSAYTATHIGFGISSGGVLSGWVGDGTANTNLTFSATSTGGTPLSLEYRLIAGTSVEFFVDGVSQGTVTTNIPSGTTASEVLIYAKVNATADVAKEVDIAYYDFSQAN